MPPAKNYSSIITRPLAIATFVVPSWPGSESRLRRPGLAGGGGHGSRLRDARRVAGDVTTTAPPSADEMAGAEASSLKIF